ncbi:MAG: hypothetical protein ACE5LH_00905 [Fidelibacterota bacterium]
MAVAGLLAILALTAYGQEMGTPRRIWSAGTARVLPEGRWETGVFQPVRVGTSGPWEWSVHPIWFFQIPNVRIKVAHPGRLGWQAASRHSVVYPTPLLRRLQKKGLGFRALAEIDFGGIITADPTVGEIPHMILSRHEIILTHRLGSSGLVTAKGGVALALRSGKLDERTTIDLPIVFPRLGVLYDGFGMNAGVDVVRRLARGLDYLVDSDLLFLPVSSVKAFEHKGLLIWTRSRKFQVIAGYKLVFGEYPFGTRWHLFPLLDLQWGWSR